MKKEEGRMKSDARLYLCELLLIPGQTGVALLQKEAEAAEGRRREERAEKGALSPGMSPFPFASDLCCLCFLL